MRKYTYPTSQAYEEDLALVQTEQSLSFAERAFVKRLRTSWSYGSMPSGPAQNWLAKLADRVLTARAEARRASRVTTTPGAQVVSN